MRPYLKSKAERAGAVAEEVEHLPIKHSSGLWERWGKKSHAFVPQASAHKI
jgi:hypothetical protein